MSLLSDLKTGPVKKETTCVVGSLIISLPEEEKEVLKDVLIKVKLDQKTYPKSWVLGVLKRNGHPVSRSSMDRHIDGDCCCGKLG